MTTFRGIKKILILAISILSLLGFVFSGIAIIQKLKPLNSQPEAGGTFNFDTHGMHISSESSYYKNNDTFLIGDSLGLWAFSISVSYGYDDHPCTFEGKTVKLTSDIVWDEFIPIGCHEDKSSGLKLKMAEGASFQGTFDGNGKMLDLNTKCVELDTESDNLLSCGMFSQTNNATIKNLRLKYNLEITEIDENCALNKIVNIGGLVGDANCTIISNCAVESFKLKIGSIILDDSRYYGGIVGSLSSINIGGLYNSAKIENCYIGNFEIDVSEVIVAGTTGNVQSSANSYFSGISNMDVFGYPSPQIKKCVVNNGGLKDGEDGCFKNWDIKVDSRVVFDSGTGQKFYSICNRMDLVDDGYCTANTTRCFDIHPFTDEVWYEAPNSSGFNGGVPYLKYFLKTAIYEVGVEGKGEVIIGNNGHALENQDNKFVVAAYKEDELPDSPLYPTWETFEYYGVVMSAKPNNGYKFKKWTQGKVFRYDENDNQYLERADYTAHFEIQEYNIFYNLDGGINDPDNPDTCTIEDDFVLQEPTKDGYEFIGWLDDNSHEPELNYLIYQTTEDIEVTACWQKMEYTITYELKGGRLETGKENPSTYNVSTPTFTLNNPIRSGATFLGWTGEGLVEPMLEVTIPQGSFGNRKYTANWNLVGFQLLTFYTDVNGREVTITANPTQYTDQDDFTLYHPQREGYVFRGWIEYSMAYGAITGMVGQHEGDVVISNMEGDKAFEAIYNAKKFSITINKAEDANGNFDPALSVEITLNGEYKHIYTTSDYVINNVDYNTEIKVTDISNGSLTIYKVNFTTYEGDWQIVWWIPNKYETSIAFIKSSLETDTIKDTYTVTENGTLKCLFYKKYKIEYK